MSRTITFLPFVRLAVRTLSLWWLMLAGCAAKPDETSDSSAMDASSDATSGSTAEDSDMTAGTTAISITSGEPESDVESSSTETLGGADMESEAATSSTETTVQGTSEGSDGTSSSEGSSMSRTRVFVTSEFYSGNLGGPEGADARCGQRADVGRLGGTWRAWVSTDSQSAAQRLDLDRGPFELVDGTLVAVDRADLLDGSLEATIFLDENGGSILHDVWTGTLADGSVAPATCGGWTDGGSTGRCGASYAADETWTDNITPGCGTPLALYCFEQ